jgi:hypothetical protein
VGARIQRIEEQLRVEAAARHAAEAGVLEEQSARNVERAETAAFQEQVQCDTHKKAWWQTWGYSIRSLVQAMLQ